MAHFSDDERKFRIRQMRNIILGFVALACLIGLAICLTALSEQQMGWVSHSFKAQRQLSRISVTAARLGTDPATGSKQLDRAIADFAAMTVDNPEQQARAARLRDMAAELTKGPGASVAIDRLIVQMQDEEDRLLDARSKRLRNLQLCFYALLGLAATALFVLAVLIYTSLWNFTQDIIRSRQALQTANQGLERAVDERTLALTRANGELRRFTYIVSHDLRAPLINIMGFTAELEKVARRLTEILNSARAVRPQSIYPETDTLIEQDLPEAIHFISASTRKMDRLITAILQLSRQNSRRLELQSVDMGALLMSITEYLHTMIERAGATISIAPGQPQIFCDRMVIEQIFSNLIENAVKYAQAGRAPVVRIVGYRLNDLAEFRVIDNGRGIAAADLDQVFDLFRRSGPQDQPGEGIGLAHVRAALYRLGGSIRVESEPGAGSTFIVSIPLHCAGEIEDLPS